MKLTAAILALAVSAPWGSLTNARAAEPGAGEGRPPLTALAVPGGEASGAEGSNRVDPAEVAADALVVRPVGLAATAVGAAVFVVALPFAALAKDVKGTAATLVGAPARFTFQRRLGHFESSVR